MEKSYDIIIGGGGIIGSLMALALVDQGLNVAIVDGVPLEKKQNLKFDGRAYALSTTTVKMLSVLNVWDKILKTAQPIFDMKVSDGIAGKGAFPFYMHFSHSDVDVGPIGYMVEDRLLKGILLLYHYH